jgi:hypothetical protein
MSESPSPHELFNFALRVAWHICGCGETCELISKSSHFTEGLLRGEFTLENSPADIRNKGWEPFIEWLRKQAANPDVNDATSKSMLERYEREGIEGIFPREQEEADYRRRIEKDRSCAKHIVKSQLTMWRSQGMPEEWIMGLDLDRFLE